MGLVSRVTVLKVCRRFVL